MFQTEPSNSQQKESESSVGAKSRRQRILRIAEVIVGIAFLALLVYVVVVAVRISKGVSRDSAQTTNLIRLQILNGCGINGLAAEIGGKLDGLSGAGLEIRVVDADNVDLKRVKKSFVISRTEDVTAARVLALKLGLNPEEVTYEPLERNVRQISATLVLGDDFGSLQFGGLKKEK